MSPNLPPIGTRAFRLFIEISAAPASWPKLEREYQARNSVTRSVSPHRIRPTHASQAVSSRLVISVNNSSERAGSAGQHADGAAEQAGQMVSHGHLAYRVAKTSRPRGLGLLRATAGRGLVVRKSRVATSSWPCSRMPSSMKEYCADLASWVARPAMTTISSARCVSVIVVTFGDRSICCTRPSMNVVTVTVPGGLRHREQWHRRRRPRPPASVGRRRRQHPTSSVAAYHRDARSTSGRRRAQRSPTPRGRRGRRLRIVRRSVIHQCAPFSVQSEVSASVLSNHVPDGRNSISPSRARCRFSWCRAGSCRRARR